MTTKQRCNVDHQGESDTATVAWTNTPMSPTVPTDTPFANNGDAAACEASALKWHETNVATKTYCAEWVYGGAGSAVNSCVVYEVTTADIPANTDLVVATTAYEIDAAYADPSAVTFIGSTNTAVAGTVTNADNNASKNKMKVNAGRNTAAGITWAAASIGLRPTGGYRINTAYDC